MYNKWWCHTVRLNCRIVGEFGSEDDRGSFRAAVAKSVDDVVKDVGGEAASKAKAREGGFAQPWIISGVGKWVELDRSLKLRNFESIYFCQMNLDALSKDGLTL